MKKIILTLILAVFGISCTSLKAKAFNAKKEYSLEGLKSLSVSTNNATIVVSPTDSKNLILEVTSSKKIEIINKKQEGSLYLTIPAPNKTHSFYILGHSSKTLVTVKIPKDFDKSLTLNTSNGNINISDLALNLKADTSNSDIRISNITGNSNLRSSNGKLIVINNTGNVDGKTSNGSINIDNNKGDIRFKTSNGNITAFQIDGSIDLKTSNSSILLTNASFIANLETSNGNITVNSDTLSKNGNIKTSNGDLELNIDKLEGNNKIYSSNGLITLTTKKGEFNSNSYSKEKVQDISKNISVGGRNLDNITIIKK